MFTKQGHYKWPEMARNGTVQGKGLYLSNGTSHEHARADELRELGDPCSRVTPRKKILKSATTKFSSVTRRKKFSEVSAQAQLLYKVSRLKTFRNVAFLFPPTCPSLWCRDQRVCSIASSSPVYN